MIPDKREIRQQLMRRRREISPAEKRENDMQLTAAILESPLFANAKLVLSYVSTSIEPDTLGIIQYCITSGIPVAVPKCDGDEMHFYRIDSFDGMKPGVFSILEPVHTDRKITQFRDSVCIVPALAYNLEKYRIGYGKGYYDRFLKHYDGVSVGICYKEFITEIPVEENDVPVDYIISV